MSDMISDEVPSIAGGGAKDFFRLIGGISGLAMIGFGGYWSVKIFFAILKVLRSPETMTPFLKAWGGLLKLESFQIVTPQTTVNLNLEWIVVSFLGGGAFLLSSIAIRLVKAGTGLLAAMVTDIESLKRMISKALASGIKKSAAQSGTNV